jgi:ABC-2 type transport system permease protein
MKESVMRREGSALHGFGVVTIKEIADHFTSILVVVLFVLIVATAVAVVLGAIGQIKEITAEDPFLFLRLFTRGALLTLVALLSFLVPLVAIGLGFDAVNGEHNRRTLSRVLSQPIYRDALLFGKFTAGVFTLAVTLIVLWLMVIGLGLLGLGVPPNAEEMARALILLVVTIAYAAFWFALALLFSVIFRSAATAALVSLGVWLFLTFLWPVFSQALADSVTTASTASDILGVLDTQLMFRRLSPTVLFNEIVAVVLDPSVRSTQQSMLASLGLVLLERGAIPDAPIPLLQSVLIVWPQIVGLVAGSILLFVIAYVVFQRQEVRA